MIKANELRKGVLIIDYTGIVREVFGEDIQQQCWHEEGQSGTTEAPLNPIHLTPEWLERCGFKDIGPYWQYNGKPGFVLLKENGVAYIGNPVRTYVKTVHQLQNLYFALTEGEELNVKL